MGIGILILLIFGVGYLYIVKKPHGFVEFKTGLVLKFLPEVKGDVDMLELRQQYIDLAADRIKKLKIKTDNVEEINIPTRHGEIRGKAFIQNGVSEKPLIVYFHGGGWCLGNVDTHTEQCTRVAIASGLSVFSIDYSLAPEHPFPRAVEECIDAVEWIYSESNISVGNTSELILMGDSAGGNLAIVVALDRLKRGVSKIIREVVPIYPVTDCYSDKKGSYKDYASGYYLTAPLMSAFEKCYFVNKEDKKSELASPILADDLADFPDTYMITAQFDPLCDEGEGFADKLRVNGVKVICKRVNGAIHGFFAREVFGRKGIVAVNELGHYLRNKYL